jgi:hypothetical protein
MCRSEGGAQRRISLLKLKASVIEMRVLLNVKNVKKIGEVFFASKPERNHPRWSTILPVWRANGQFDASV